jgi:ABC-type sulfate/molybdate transport systems ATPase subunit
VSEGWSASVRARVGDLQLDVDLQGDGVLGLVGPNGSGKTTLLRALVGGLPFDGRFVVGDRVLVDTARGVSVPIEDRGVGYVPQGGGLFPHLSALDQVAFGADRARADAALCSAGLDSLRHRRPAQLSGGERQQVALLRALLPGPRLLLLDEPMASLDAAARQGARQRLGEHLAAAAVPALLVTHDLRDLVALGAQRVVVLEGGRVVRDDRLEAVRRQPRGAFERELVGA